MGVQVYFMLAIFLVVQIQSAFSASWSYSRTANDGPSKWSSSYADCGKTSQSPIDIATPSVVVDTTLGQIAMNNYTVAPTSMTLENNGHTAKVTTVGVQSISGGGLSTTFNLAQFHFHWGTSGGTNGSEHTVNGKSYPLEVHFVHYDSSMGSIGNAADKAGGLAVLGYFFETSSSDNTALNPIIDQLSSITANGATKALTTFALNTILPSGTNFYRYSGSLTTPGCYETVTWSVMDSKISISEAQLAKFYALLGSSGAIVDNFRPVQALQGRTVKATFNPNSASISRPVWSLFLAAIMSLALLKN